jgi:hypothetical protein
LFYTDGFTNYPDKEVRELNNCGIDFRFYGYSETSSEYVFKLMFKELRGYMNENVQTEKLGNSFIAVMDALRAQQ